MNIMESNQGRFWTSILALHMNTDTHTLIADVGFHSVCYEYCWLMNIAALVYSGAELSKAGIISR